MSRCLIPAILFVFLFSPPVTFAQQEAANWYFGEYAGITFKSGTAQPLTDGRMRTSEGCATISDKNGNLLFYTDGTTVYNKNHQEMPNGKSLMGHNSSTQSAVIAPLPGSNTKYFVFTVSVSLSGLHYSVVDMTLDGGLGDVAEKNIHVLDSAVEKLTAVRHCNNRDVWIITRKYGTDLFYAFLLDAGGLANNPVISATGNIITGGLLNAIGVIKSSPDGKKLAAANDYDYDFIELLDFDNSTGKLSNPLKLTVRPFFASSGETGVYGLEFSPDSRQLYTTSMYDFSRTYLIHQFDITKVSQHDIQQTLTLLDSRSTRFGALQLAPDGKIYITEVFSNYLSVINKPNQPGALCDYRYSSFLLGDFDKNKSILGLPNFLQSYLNINPDYDFNMTGNCSSLTQQFVIKDITDIDSVRWNFNDPGAGALNSTTALSPVHTYSQPGYYTVSLTVYRKTCNAIDTVRKRIWLNTGGSLLGNDTAICRGESVTFQSPFDSPDADFLWSTGESNRMIKADQPGKYALELRLYGCTYRDTVSLTVKDLPAKFSLGADRSICNNDIIRLEPDILMQDVSYEWNTNDVTPFVDVAVAGQYILRVKNADGCQVSDTVEVQRVSLPGSALLTDTVACTGDTVFIGRAVTGVSGYLWNNGSTSAALQVHSSGTFWREVKKDNCTLKDTVTVNFRQAPQVELGKDTAFCEGESIVLDAGITGAAFAWNTSETTQAIRVNKPGKYVLTVTKDGCAAKDSIAVKQNNKPVFSLGSDQLFCEATPVILNPAVQGGVYKWFDGSDQRTYQVTKPGVVYVDISNSCGTTRDSVIFSKGVCALAIPNAFSPNNDGVNDVFRVKGTGDVSQFTFSVFNRWGQKIFETKTERHGWDGRVNGKEVPPGTYVFLFRYTMQGDAKEKVIRGSVMLVR